MSSAAGRGAEELTRPAAIVLRSADLGIVLAIRAASTFVRSVHAGQTAKLALANLRHAEQGAQRPAGAIRVGPAVGRNAPTSQAIAETGLVGITIGVAFTSRHRLARARDERLVVGRPALLAGLDAVGVFEAGAAVGRRLRTSTRHVGVDATGDGLDPVYRSGLAVFVAAGLAIIGENRRASSTERTRVPVGGA